MQLSQVVPIHNSYLPTEGAPLLVKWLQAEHLIDPAKALPPIAVHDGRQVAKLVVRSEHRGLPCRPLVALAVAESYIDLAGQPSGPEAERHPRPHTQTVAERPGGRLHPRHAGVRMSFEWRPWAAEGGQVRPGNEADVGDREAAGNM